MIRIQNIYIIAKKDLRNFFESPTAYVILMAFLLLWQFIFFQNVFLIGRSSLMPMFDLLPWLLLFLVPALTMGSISQELGDGTIELLLTHPLKQIEFILGKFFSVLFLFSLAILFSLPVAVSLSWFGSFDWGAYCGQLLAAFFSGALLISLGIFVSSLLTSQISSMILSAIGSFFLLILGAEIITAGLPSWLGQVFESLAVSSHYHSMARGVIDFRDVWYFVSAIVIFLSLSYLALLRRKISRNKKQYRSLKVGISVLVLIVIVTNLLGSHLQARLDLTQEQTFTLSQGTKDIVSGLKDLVKINVYVSKELPAQVQPVLKEVKDILGDYQALGGSNLEIKYKDPSSDSGSVQEAMANGINQIQFNIVDKEELSLKNGFFGLSVSYAGQHRSIPFIQSTSDLEFQLTSFINELTTDNKPKIAFLDGQGEKAQYEDLSKDLGTQFSIDKVKIDDKIKEIPADLKALVVANPSQKVDDATRTAIKSYLDKGGSLLLMVDQQEVDQSLSATANKDNFADFAKEFGVTIDNNLVYDLRSNETINFSNGMMQYFVPYPFFARVKAEPGSQITAKIESAVLPWASSLQVDADKIKSLGYQYHVLLKTTQFAGEQKEPFSVSPQENLSQTGLGEKIMAVSLEKPVATDAKKLTRVVIIGDADVMSDRFSFFKENQAFGANVLSWLTQEKSLSDIKLKAANDRKLTFKDETQMGLVRYGNLAIVILLPLVFGLFNYLRRRYKRGMVFKK